MHRCPIGWTRSKHRQLSDTLPAPHTPSQCLIYKITEPGPRARDESTPERIGWHDVHMRFNLCITASNFWCTRSLSIVNLISRDFSDAQSKEKTKTKEMSESLKDFEHLLHQTEVDRRAKRRSNCSYTALCGTFSR